MEIIDYNCCFYLQRIANGSMDHLKSAVPVVEVEQNAGSQSLQDQHNTTEGTAQFPSSEGKQIPWIATLNLAQVTHTMTVSMCVVVQKGCCEDCSFLSLWPVCYTFAHTIFLL